MSASALWLDLIKSDSFAYRESPTSKPVDMIHPGVLDISGRRDFSRFDPSPGEAPQTLANLVRPWSEDLFVK